MKSPAQILIASAADAARQGRQEEAVGYFIAAQAAGADPRELRSRILDVLEAMPAPSMDEHPAGHLAHLTIKAVASRSPIHLRELIDALDGQAPEMIVAATESQSELLDEDGGVSLLLIEQARLAAQERMAGANKKAALRRAAEAVLPRLDALAAANPGDLHVLSTHYTLSLQADRYLAAIKNLRQLLPTHAENPFVHVNLSALLRSADHPEVRTSLRHIIANLPDVPSELHPWFVSMLACEAIPEAFQILDRMIERAPEYAMIRNLRAMADDFDQAPAHRFGVAPSGRHLIYASMVCWGGKYLDLMEEIAIASLLSPRNFPALCAENDLVVDFVTMPEDAPRLLAMPGLQALARLCEIRIYLFPALSEESRPHVSRLSYNFLGAGSALTMKRAERDGADLIFLIPDVVYAEGSFAHVASLVTKEPRALMSDGLNTLAKPMLEALEPHRDRTRSSLTVSLPDLIDYASQNLMPRTTDFFFDPERPDVISYPQRVVFREKEGLVIHAFSKLAVYVSHAGYAPLGQVNYGTPDSFLTNHLMKRLSKRHLRQSDGDMKFAMIELADDDGRLWPRTTEPLIDAIEQMYRDFGFHINCFNLFETGDLFPIRVPYSDRLTTAAQREAFLAQLWAARRSRGVFTELCMERTKHDRPIEDSHESQ